MFKILYNIKSLKGQVHFLSIPAKFTQVPVFFLVAFNKKKNYNSIISFIQVWFGYLKIFSVKVG
jgi:hypothetical protein